MQHAKSIYDQLAALQHQISEDDLVAAILRGLDKIYRPFIRNIEAIHQFVSFDDLFSLLLSREI